jgi:hypothetical protein
VNRTETAALLTLVAGLDNREANPVQAAMWHELLEPFPFAECRSAVMAHFAESTDYLMPAHIVKRVRAGRVDDRTALDAAPPASDGRPRPANFAELVEQGRAAVAGRYRRTERADSFGEACQRFVEHDPTPAAQAQAS